MDKLPENIQDLDELIEQQKQKSGAKNTLKTPPIPLRERIQIPKVLITMGQIFFIVIILAIVHIVLPKQPSLINLKDREPALSKEQITSFGVMMPSKSERSLQPSGTPGGFWGSGLGYLGQVKATIEEENEVSKNDYWFWESPYARGPSENNWLTVKLEPDSETKRYIQGLNPDLKSQNSTIRLELNLGTELTEASKISQENLNQAIKNRVLEIVTEPTLISLLSNSTAQFIPNPRDTYPYGKYDYGRIGVCNQTTGFHTSLNQNSSLGKLEYLILVANYGGKKNIYDLDCPDNLDIKWTFNVKNFPISTAPPVPVLASNIARIYLENILLILFSGALTYLLAKRFEGKFRYSLLSFPILIFLSIALIETQFYSSLGNPIGLPLFVLISFVQSEIGAVVGTFVQHISLIIFISFYLIMIRKLRVNGVKTIKSVALLLFLIILPIATFSNILFKTIGSILEQHLRN